MPSSASNVGSILVVVPAELIVEPVRSPRVAASPLSGSVATTVLGSNVGSVLPCVAGALVVSVVGGVVVGAVVV